MTMQGCYSIYDEKAEAYLPPFFLQTDAMATRAFTDCVVDLNHQFGRHPADYTLYRIASWDPVLGEITETGLQLIITGLAARAAARPGVRPGSEEELDLFAETGD